MVNVAERQKAADEKMARKQLLNSFLNSAGFHEFFSDLMEHVKGVEGQIEDNTRGYINASRLDVFNYNLGEKAGLKRVLNILEGYQEELEG